MFLLMAHSTYQCRLHCRKKKIYLVDTSMCLVNFHKYFTIECVSNYKILYDSYWHVLSEKKFCIETKCYVRKYFASEENLVSSYYKKNTKKNCNQICLLIL